MVTFHVISIDTTPIIPYTIQSMSITDEKERLRERMKAQRVAMSETDHAAKSAAITGHLTSLREWREASVIHCYIASVNHEAETQAIRMQAWNEGKTVIVPVCGVEAGEMHCIRLDGDDALNESRFGLLEPLYERSRLAKPEDISLVVAPLLAFDRTGGRLGFGGGYYDRFLTQVRCPIVGIAFSMQEVDKAPMDEHDIPLDMVVTEHETIYCT